MINHNSAGRASTKSQAHALISNRRRPSRMGLGKLIKAQFSDGKCHSFDTIVAMTQAPVGNVWSTLDLMWRWGTYKTKCERKKVGTQGNGGEAGSQERTKARQPVPGMRLRLERPS
jgi:hypothetical protein